MQVNMIYLYVFTVKASRLSAWKLSLVNNSHGVPQPLGRFLYKTYCNLRCFKRANITKMIKSMMISVFMCHSWEVRDGERI